MTSLTGRGYVPTMAGRLAAVQRFAPRRVAEKLPERLGRDTVFLDDVDQAARRAYEERARHS